MNIKYAAPCGILTVYTLDHGERVALAELQEWIVLHIRKSRCTPCDVAYYGLSDVYTLDHGEWVALAELREWIAYYILGDGPELQDSLPF